MAEHDEFEEHEGIDVDRVRERVKRRMSYRRPMWQILMLIWLGIMAISWLFSGFGFSMMRGRSVWSGSPWIIFFLLVMGFVWWQRARAPRRSTSDDELDRAIRREIRRERQHMATGYWGEMPDADVEQAEKRKREDTAEPPLSERVMHLGDDGELIFDDDARPDDAEQHHSTTV